MSATQKQSTGLIQFTAAAAYTAGEVVLLEDSVGVIQDDAAIGDLAVLDIFGNTYEIACLGTDVINPGDSLYWDDGNSRLTLTATSNFYAGKAMNASPNGTAVVHCLLVNGNGVAG